MELKNSEYKFFFKITKEKLNDYAKRAVYFSKPRILTLFEYNYGEIYKAQRMKYLKIPDPYQYPIDLNADLASFIPRDPATNFHNIDFVLKYMASPAANSVCNNVDKTKVITRSGTLAYLMELSQNRKSFAKHVLVSRYNNNLYMIAIGNDDNARELKSVNTHHSQLDHMLFADSPQASPKTTDPCDENVMLIAVHQSHFGKYDIFYSAELQGIMGDEPISDFDDLDEMIDRRLVLTKQMWKKLENNDNKYLQYWLQAYLGNVRDIYIGFKTETGVIEEPIKYFSVKDLPNNRYWKPSICTGFLHQFLQNVENLMSSVNCLNTVYEFQFDKKTHCFYYKIFAGRTEKSFISKEYQTACKKF